MNKNEYIAIVNAVVCKRFRIVMLLGTVLYLGFSLLDWVSYPEFFQQFLIIRLMTSTTLLVGYALSYLVPEKYIVWLCDTTIVLAGAGLAAMIYLADGAASGYYQGLNLVFLAGFTINSFFIWHILATCLCISGLYTLAILASASNAPIAQAVSAFFFMGSTQVFVWVLTRLYSDQHRSEVAKTAELAVTAAKLNESNQKLIATEKRKDEFFANVSHELRTPLALILGPVRKHLSRAGVTPDERRDFSIVERNAMLLLNRVNDLLDISKVDAGMMDVDYTRADIAKLVRFTMSHFEVLRYERMIALHIDLPAVLVAEVDVVKVEKIIFNLISNAFKFTPDGGSIRCQLRAGGDHFSLAVEDNGPGIPERQQAAIFERFRQVDFGDARGTGLGLAIAMEFVKIHKGSLTVRNREPSGAAFLVRMPLAAPVGTVYKSPPMQLENSRYEMARQAAFGQTDVRATTNEKIASASASLPAAAPLVLVVEDHAEMSQFICEALVNAGMRVCQAFNGKQGLEMALHRNPDLILSDVMMPQMNGEQMIFAIRARLELDDIPIIMLTAKADDRLREHLLQAAVQDYLCKPFSIAELISRVRNLITMKKVRDVMAADLSNKEHDVLTMAHDLTEGKRRLEEALRSAEAALRAKDEFLMNMSHELRTPLTAILGWAELAMSGSVEASELHSALATIERNARSELRLVNDLLDMARIMRGNLKLNMKPVKIERLIRSTMRSLEQTAAVKSISLRLESDYGEGAARIDEVHCDARRMRQIVWNLLSNAIKFTPNGGTVEVILSSDEGQALIKVKDNGEGIEPDFIPLVFERLRQGDSFVAKRHGGIGLGLAICRHLVELHGGTIVAESAGKGAGAVFTVRLPVALPPVFMFRTDPVSLERHVFKDAARLRDL